MSEENVNIVRTAFFNFFMEPLKYLPQFIDEKVQSAEIDTIFQHKNFLKCFSNYSIQEYRYLELFTSLSLFTRLIERVTFS